MECVVSIFSFILVAVIFGPIAGGMAQRRGRDVVLWTLLGAFGSWCAILALAFLGDTGANRNRIDGIRDWK